MKKGFTMIELIFVIVILGILAAVAIPRLAATRDDAEMSKAAANLATVTKDLAGYYTSQGNFSDNINKMTNVILVDSTGTPVDEISKATNGIYLQVKKAICFKFEFGTVNVDENTGKVEMGEDGNPEFTVDINTAGTDNVYLSQADAIQITADPKGVGKKICTELYNLPAIKSTMSQAVVKPDTRKVYQVGGTGVVYDAFEAE